MANEFLRDVFRGKLKDVKASLQGGQSANTQEERYGLSAVHIACIKDNLTALRLLHKNGAKLELTTTKDVPTGVLVFDWQGVAGSTPLIVAVQRNSCKCARQLLEWGVRVNSRDSRKKNALDYAVTDEMKAVLQGSDYKQPERSSSVLSSASSVAVPAAAPVDPANDLKLLGLIMNQMDSFADKLEKVRNERGSSSSSQAAVATSPSPKSHSKTTLGSFGSFFMKEYMELKALRNQLLAQTMRKYQSS